MEALGLDMAWAQPPSALTRDSRSSSPLTPLPDTPMDESQEGSPEPFECDTAASAVAAGQDSPSIAQQGISSEKSKAKAKRKERPTGFGDLFGPPRQSVRIRIHETAKEDVITPLPVPTGISPTVSVKDKKSKKREKKEEKKIRRDSVIAHAEPGYRVKREALVGTSRETHKSGAEKPKRRRMKPFDLEPASGRYNDEQFSLEAMSASLPFSSSSHAGTTVIISRKGKGKGKASMRAQAENTIDDGAPAPRTRGIRSSTFARVMRLVADLPLVELPGPKVKRMPAKHRPPVWAASRQELCEALPYYRAFQAGLYSHQKVAFGYLLDGFPAPRDVCAHNARVIISHGGGQCIRPLDADGKNLPPVLAGDQLLSDARVAALVRAWERKTPLVLLAGSGYALLPFKLDCSYVVLGWYWVSHVWTEAEPAAKGVDPPRGRDWYKRVKVRFDWVDNQGEPWWEQEAGPSASASEKNAEPIVEVAQTSEAKRVSVSHLVESPGQSVTQPMRPRLLRNDTVVSTYSAATLSSSSRTPTPSTSRASTPSSRQGSQRRDKAMAPVDPATGLLTPPITPPTDACIGRTRTSEHAAPADTHASSPHTSAIIIGEGIAAQGSVRRRLPGEYRLATFGETSESTDDHESGGLPMRQCRYCKSSSPAIYREGWMCLTTSCTAYWLLQTNTGLLPIPPSFKLAYSPDFLAHLATPPGTKIPYDVVPPPPKIGIPDETGSSDQAGSRSLWRGWVCENCGRANCRFRWEVWQCLSCRRLLAPIDPYSDIVPARSLLPYRAALLGNPIIDPNSGISVEVRRVDHPAATIMIYHLPDRIGTIYHFINDCNDFADGVFDRCQREAASTRVPLFQRRPLNAHQIKGQLLAQHFAVNSGVSYKYNVDSLSLSFDESPSCVIQALEAITQRAQVTVGQKVEFNEILSVLYRDGQKMSWHDDGEPGLGPVVAGLSLGSDAVISWRRKIAHSASNATYNTGLPDPRKEANHPIALSLTTSHGDIVMMQGRDMQKKYVHRVIPTGFRMAATAREIGK